MPLNHCEHNNIYWVHSLLVDIACLPAHLAFNEKLLLDSNFPNGLRGGVHHFSDVNRTNYDVVFDFFSSRSVQLILKIRPYLPHREHQMLVQWQSSNKHFATSGFYTNIFDHLEIRYYKFMGWLLLLRLLLLLTVATVCLWRGSHITIIIELVQF